MWPWDRDGGDQEQPDPPRGRRSPSPQSHHGHPGKHRAQGSGSRAGLWTQPGHSASLEDLQSLKIFVFCSE